MWIFFGESNSDSSIGQRSLLHLPQRENSSSDRRVILTSSHKLSESRKAMRDYNNKRFREDKDQNQPPSKYARYEECDFTVIVVNDESTIELDHLSDISSEKPGVRATSTPHHFNNSYYESRTSLSNEFIGLRSTDYDDISEARSFEERDSLLFNLLDLEDEVAERDDQSVDLIDLISNGDDDTVTFDQFVDICIANAV